MNITDVIMTNLFVLAMAPIAGAVLGERDHRVFWAWFTFCAVVGVSLLGWVTFAVAHFIIKFW